MLHHKIMPGVKSERGAIPILILVSIIGILAFVVFSNFASFKDRLFNTLFPKPPSYATAAFAFTKSPSTSIMSGRSGNFDAVVADPAVIHDSDGSYKMWYSSIATGTGPGRGTFGYASSSSPDNTSWTRKDTPVLTNGTPGTWDGYAVETPWVLKDDAPALPGETYKMYYAGYPSVKDAGGIEEQQQVQIGLTTSPDGVNNWTRNGANPIIAPDFSCTTKRSFCFGVWGPVVIKDDGTYKMWFLGAGPDIANTKMLWNLVYATSSDGVSWTVNAIPQITADPDSIFKKISDIAVVKLGTNDYRLWFSATKGDDNNYETWSATSTDGINWNINSSSPALARGSAGAWDYYNAFAPSALAEGDSIKMWYHGMPDGDMNHLQIGYSYSTTSEPTPTITLTPTPPTPTPTPTRFPTPTPTRFPTPSPTLSPITTSYITPTPIPTNTSNKSAYELLQERANNPPSPVTESITNPNSFITQTPFKLPEIEIAEPTPTPTPKPEVTNQIIDFFIQRVAQVFNFFDNLFHL